MFGESSFGIKTSDTSFTTGGYYSQDEILLTVLCNHIHQPWVCFDVVYHVMVRPIGGFRFMFSSFSSGHLQDPGRSTDTASILMVSIPFIPEK